MVAKLCGICHKPHEETTKTCKACKEYQKKWKAANRDKANKYSLKWYRKHREARLPIMRQYYYRTRGTKYRTRGTKHTTNEPPCSPYDRVLSSQPHAKEMRVWREANPDKARALRHNYKSKKRGNGGKYTGEQLNELFEKQDGKCFYCGDLIYSSFNKELHVDHKNPLTRGGTNDISNIALACSKCNLSKHVQTAEEFLAKNKRR